MQCIWPAELVLGLMKQTIRRHSVLFWNSDRPRLISYGPLMIVLLLNELGTQCLNKKSLAC